MSGLLTSSHWLLTDTAAKHLGMHPDTLRDLYRRGEVKAIKRGKAWRTKQEWLDDYIAGCAA